MAEQSTIRPVEASIEAAEGVVFWARLMPHLWLLNSTTMGLAQMLPQVLRLSGRARQIRSELARTPLHPTSQHALKEELIGQRDLLDQVIGELQAARDEVAAALQEMP